MGGLLLRRRGMMQSASASIPPTPILPSEYQEVDYIYANGTLHLPTSLRFPQTSLVLKGSFSADGSLTREQYLISDRDSGGVRLGILAKAASGVCKFSVYSETRADYSSTSVSENIVVFTASISGSGSGNTVTAKGSMNGTAFNVSATGNTRVYGNNSIKFFDANGSTKLKGRMIGRLSVTNGSGLVYEFIPCYRIADSAVGIYETETGNFYTHSSLTKGNDIN